MFFVVGSRWGMVLKDVLAICLHYIVYQVHPDSWEDDLEV